MNLPGLDRDVPNAAHGVAPGASELGPAQRDDGARDGVAGDVLALRALGLGDALTGVPALRGLRRAFPDRRLVLAAPPAVGGWLRSLGVVDAVLPTRDLTVRPAAGVARGHRLVGVNLHGRGPQSHRLLAANAPARLVAFACPEVGVTGPEWDPTEHEVERWCRLVRAAGGRCGAADLRLPHAGARRGHVVVHPGAAAPARRWPPDRWIAVVQELAAQGHDVVLTGGLEEAALCAGIQAAVRGTAGGVTSTAGRLTLPDLADVVATAALLLSGDTGVAHVATAYATPSVLLFGPTPPGRWAPATGPHVVLWHGDPDRPGDPHGAVVDPTLTRITVDEVLGAVAAFRPGG